MSNPDDRIIDNQSKPDDRLDYALRPRSLGDLIGQERVKENLAILIAAAQQRAEPVDHILFYGPPGLGKTTLAQDQRLNDLEIWQPFLRICGLEIFYSLMRSTAWAGPLRKCFTRQWRILPWIS
jgi:DNA helicase TIP49 (TBP-interacting protein)